MLFSDHKQRRAEIDVNYLFSSHGVELEEVTCPAHVRKQRYMNMVNQAATIESHSCLFWNEVEEGWKHDGCWVCYNVFLFNRC